MYLKDAGFLVCNERKLKTKTATVHQPLIKIMSSILGEISVLRIKEIFGKSESVRILLALEGIL